MAFEQDYALWIQAAGLVNDAHDYRRLLGRLLGWDNATAGGTPTEGTGNGGVTRPGDFAVTQRSAGANMSVDVAAGGVVVWGTENSNQGAYFAYNDAVLNVVIQAAHLTLARKDLVGVQIRDSEYGATGSNDARVVVITGTAGASPAEPAVPENFVTLALVDVPAADTAISTSQVTDRRRRVTALGGLIVMTSTTRPSVGLWAGMHGYETDTGDMLVVEPGGFWAWSNGPGMTMDWFGATVPSEWDFMYGQAISRSTYARLFARLGTTHGVGDGSTTFNLPDARGRVTVGKDNMGGTAVNRVTTGGSGLNAAALGATGGNQAMQSHAHGTGQALFGPGLIDFAGGTQSFITTTTTAGTGGSQNVQPSIVANKIMRLR